MDVIEIYILFDVYMHDRLLFFLVKKASGMIATAGRRQ